MWFRVSGLRCGFSGCQNLGFGVWDAGLFEEAVAATQSTLPGTRHVEAVHGSRNNQKIVIGFTIRTAILMLVVITIMMITIIVVVIIIVKMIITITITIVIIIININNSKTH